MVNSTDVPTREEIEIRAYELYLERGATNGFDVEDWLAAESELSVARPRNSQEKALSKAYGAGGNIV